MAEGGVMRVYVGWKRGENGRIKRREKINILECSSREKPKRCHGPVLGNPRMRYAL